MYRIHPPMQEMQEIWIGPCVRKILWRRECQPTPVFLPGESHGQRSLVGYSPGGHTKSDTTEQLTLSFPTAELKFGIKETSWALLHSFLAPPLIPATAVVASPDQASVTVHRPTLSPPRFLSWGFSESDSYCTRESTPVECLLIKGGQELMG